MTSRRSFELPASAFSSLCLLVDTILGAGFQAYHDVDFNKPPDNRKNPHFPLNKIPAKTSSPRYTSLLLFLKQCFS
jgi:hypothetical protein